MFSTRLLSQFIAVAEELHFGRAAIRVNIAQSPLSQAIQRLERTVGTPLFVRSRRAVALTAAGQVFLREARQILKNEQAAIERTVQAAEGVSGYLTVGFIGSTGYGYMPVLVRRFRQEFPEVQLKLLEMTTQNQIEGLENRHIDVGLLRTPLPGDPLFINTALYARDRLMLAVPKGHSLADRKKIGLLELKDELFVVFSKEHVPGANAQTIAVCLEAGFYPKIAQECSQVASIICVIAAGLAIALIPSNLAELIHPKVAYLEIEENLKHLHQEVSIAWHAENENPALFSFLKIAHSVGLCNVS